MSVSTSYASALFEAAHADKLDAATMDKIEADLSAIVPVSEQVKFCPLLQRHGREICTAKNPKCEICPIQDLCPKIGVVTVQLAKRRKEPRSR